MSPTAARRTSACRLCLLLLFVALAGGCRGGNAPPGSDRQAGNGSAFAFPDDAPRLVLLLVIDQGSADAINRDRALLDGGLARLMAEGVQFTDAHQAHAVTETAPGHATLATGRYPSHHGIIANDWIDRESGDEIYAVDDPTYDVSPANLAVDTLGDWLRDAAPDAKVFSASEKDRAAILMGGHRANGAFWYSRSTGRFVTSGYYAAGCEAPAWLEQFDDQQAPVEWYGTPWRPLPEVEAKEGALGAASVDLGAMTPSQTFPHAVGRLSLAPDESYFRALYGTPFADVYLERFVEAMIDGEDLGADETPDLLAVSFSALDAVGHRYGPDSPEYADTLLRLDRTVGRLLDAVDRRVGLDHTLVMLSADHGVLEAPEVLAARGEDAARVGDGDIACFHQVEQALDARWGDADWLRPGPFLNPEAVDAMDATKSHEEKEAEVEAEVRHDLEACPHVARVWTRGELSALEAPPPPAAGTPSFPLLYAHAFYPPRSPDFMVRFTPEFMTTTLPTVATHGSPYPYDTHVPWIVRLPDAATAGPHPGPERRIDRYVETVDVAPTAAALLGLTPPADVDGTDRSGALRDAARHAGG